MENDDALAAPVRSILATARERPTPAGRVDVDARSLPAAIDAARTDGRTPLIAEVKPTSPTAGGHRSDDPVALAEAMVAGGACAVSVLTEPDHFGGSPGALRAVRQAVDVPVLRKDFILRAAQLDTVAADVVLLIARFLDDDLGEMVTAARDRGFQVLVETHTRGEVERALAADATIVGVNNRDLAALEVDLGTTERVAPAVPESVTLVAESGIGSPADVRRMHRAGADCLLVGSSIMDHEGGETEDGGAGNGTTAGVTARTRRLTTAGTQP